MGFISVLEDILVELSLVEKLVLGCHVSIYDFEF